MPCCRNERFPLAHCTLARSLAQKPFAPFKLILMLCAILANLILFLSVHIVVLYSDK